MRLAHLLLRESIEPRQGDRFRADLSMGTFTWEISNVNRGTAYIYGNLKPVILALCQIVGEIPFTERHALWAFEIAQGIGNREAIDTDNAYLMFLKYGGHLISAKADEAALAFGTAITIGISEAYRSYRVEWVQ